MFIDLTPEQHRLRLRVRDYFNALMTPELRSALRGAESGDDFRQTYSPDGPRRLAGRGLAQGAWRPGPMPRPSS